MSVPDPSFELDDGSWSLNDRAEIQSVQAYHEENALKLRATSDFDGSNLKNGQATATLTETIGVETRVKFWFYPDETYNQSEGEIQLRYLISPSGNPAFFTVQSSLSPDDFGSGWQQFTTKTFTPTDTAPLLRFESGLDGSLSGGIATAWYVDLVTDKQVAIRLSERAIDAVVATLDANLSAELTAIDTDRGDGLTMTAPATADYHKFPKGVIGGSRAQVEVFEAGGFEFSHDYTDHQNQRAVYTVPLMVRLTWFNENVETVDKMHKRARRYASAVKIVLVKNPTLEDDDDSIKVARVSGFVMHHEVEGEDSDKVAKMIVEMPIEVDCEEVA